MVPLELVRQFVVSTRCVSLFFFRNASVFPGFATVRAPNDSSVVVRVWEPEFALISAPFLGSGWVGFIEIDAAD
eukprot:scaffold52547_cov57-Attheya_sp.AAC.5